MVSKPVISSTKKSTITKSKDIVSTKKPKNGFATKVTSTTKLIYGKVKAMPLIAAIVAEFIGTFLLVATFLALTVAGSPILVAFTLIGIVLIVGGISGAHLNPAVTIGAWVTRKINAMRALGYVVAQTLGALAGSAMLSMYLNGTKDPVMHAGVELIKAAKINEGKELYIFFAELLGVVVLSFAIATAIRYKNNKTAAALAQGFGMMLALTIVSSLTVLLTTQNVDTFSFINPVIAIASGGVTIELWPIAVYIIAPIIGGIIGFAIQDFLNNKNEDCCDCCSCK